MNSSRISYRSRPDATPEAELNALATCYRFILIGGNASKQEAAESAQPDGRDSAVVGDRKEGGSRVDQSKETKERSYQVTTKGTYDETQL
jgi:hypothetical protein